MTEPTEFARACRDASRDLRRLPKDLRRTLAQRVRPDVADPLAGDIRADYRGPWANVLSAATKTRVSGDPQIVVGGSRRVVSGGAAPRQLVYGAQFGGGKKVAEVTRRTKHKGTVRYRRRTTAQFRNPVPTIFPTIGRTIDKTLDRFARIVGEVLDNG